MDNGATPAAETRPPETLSAQLTKSQQAPECSPHEFRKFTPHELMKFTDGFSRENFLGETKFAKFYRGRMETRAVTVKVFIDSHTLSIRGKHSRFRDEIRFYEDSRVGQIQYLAKSIGHCPESPGVVYDAKPKDTLENLIVQDNFTWLQRMKVALQLAHLLVFLHKDTDHPLLVLCNIHAAQIIVDEDYNLVLLDFGMPAGGILCREIDCPANILSAAYNHRDLQFLTIGRWCMTHDVLSYGVLLLSLIAKRVFDTSRPETSVELWAKKCCRDKMSLSELERNAFNVHEIFKEDPDYDVYDANKCMKLAMSCIELLPNDRPTMMQIYQALETLHVSLLNGLGENVKSEVLEFLPCELRNFTGDFSERSFLGKTQFGKLYHGEILDGANQNEVRAVTVKIWDDSVFGSVDPMEKWSRLTDEVYFLQQPSVYRLQKNLAKPIGYSRKCELMGIVYDINPRDTLHNLILKDDFTWLQRIKVALQFADLLVFFHNFNPPYIVRNIDAAHIMVDQDTNPVLFDVGMLVGGLFGTASGIPNGKVHGALGYEDLHFLGVGEWSITRDVFSYGVLLLSLIVKKVFDVTKPETSVALWAKTYSIQSTSPAQIESIFSHVNQLFKEDPLYNAYDAYRIIKLAMSCIEFFPKDRPSMKQAYESLQALRIVQHTGIGQASGSLLREFLPEEWREINLEKKFLGNMQFAKVYHGKIPCGVGQTRAVMVKVWELSKSDDRFDVLEKMSELMDEVYLLQHLSRDGHQQNLAKQIGYSHNYQCLGIVYDLDPMGTLHELIREDKFKWLQRIKVALQLARLLSFFHKFEPPFIVRNISAAHILVDKEYNPLLFDFGMMMGGFLGNVRDFPKRKLYGAPGYEDPHILTCGGWNTARDVFSFGIVLLRLFANVVSDGDRPEKNWALWAYQESRSLMSYREELVDLVNGNFKDDTGYNRADALQVIRVALKCVEYSPKDRPTMDLICTCLKKLHVAKRFKREVGILDT